MGYRCRWIAMAPKMAAPALAKLKLERAAQAEEPIYDPGLYAVALPTGWFVVFADGSEHMSRLQERDAADLSSDGDALFFYCDDTPMCTRLALYSGGTAVWALEHDGSVAGSAMQTTGSVPERAMGLLREARVAQAAEDPGDEWPVDHLYDVTATFALEYIGFRHDVTLTEDDFPQTWELNEA